MSAETNQICDFFKHQTIFITGGTGFVGKLLIEKLLRRCYDLRRIYVLMRPKKGKTAQDRFEEFFNFPCFDLIRHKNLKEKISLISGDCNEPLLGLKPEDAETLKKETTCILHVAANVKFEQSLKEASYNVNATRDILQMAGEMPKLQVFVYVSTAYSNCIYSHVKEEVYEPPMKAETLLGLVESFDEEILEKITPSLLGRYPNTYVYIKAITEDLIKRANLSTPVAIIRPAIICNALEEPLVGWVDNFYGFIGVITCANMGIARSLYGERATDLNLVPVDHVCNCILAAAWKTAEERRQIKIYNCVGNAINCGGIETLLNSNYWQYASDKYLWYKSFKVRESRFWHNLWLFLPTIPLYLVDYMSLLIGRSTKIVSKYKNLNNMLHVLKYFTTNQWNFDQHNVTDLWKNMNHRERSSFTFLVEDFDWNHYYAVCASGIRVYLLNDPLETIPKGQQRLTKLFYLHSACMILLYFSSYKFVRFLIKMILPYLLHKLRI